MFQFKGGVRVNIEDLKYNTVALNPCEIVKPLKGKLVIEGEK